IKTLSSPAIAKSGHAQSTSAWAKWPAFEKCWLKNMQIPARHFLGLRNSKQSQQRRRNILQRAAFAQRPARFIHHDKWHRIGGVIGVRPMGRGVDHHLGVSMV